MLKVYDEFLEDETICALRDRTYRLHMSALIYCSKNLTDGVVTERAVKVLQLILGYPLKKHVAELVEVRVWVEVEGGYAIRNYLEFNPNAETVKKERAKARQRMRELREKRACSGEPAAEPSDEQAGERSHAVPNRSFAVKDLQPKALGLAHLKTTIDESLKEAS